MLQPSLDALYDTVGIISPTKILSDLSKEEPTQKSLSILKLLILENTHHTEILNHTLSHLRALPFKTLEFINDLTSSPFYVHRLFVISLNTHLTNNTHTNFTVQKTFGGYEDLILNGNGSVNTQFHTQNIFLSIFQNEILFTIIHTLLHDPIDIVVKSQIKALSSILNLCPTLFPPEYLNRYIEYLSTKSDYLQCCIVDIIICQNYIDSDLLLRLSESDSWRIRMSLTRKIHIIATKMNEGIGKRVDERNELNNETKEINEGINKVVNEINEETKEINELNKNQNNELNIEILNSLSLKLSCDNEDEIRKTLVNILPHINTPIISQLTEILSKDNNEQVRSVIGSNLHLPNININNIFNTLINDDCLEVRMSVLKGVISLVEKKGKNIIFNDISINGNLENDKEGEYNSKEDTDNLTNNNNTLVLDSFENKEEMCSLSLILEQLNNFVNSNKWRVRLFVCDFVLGMVVLGVNFYKKFMKKIFYKLMSDKCNEIRMKCFSVYEVMCEKWKDSFIESNVERIKELVENKNYLIRIMACYYCSKFLDKKCGREIAQILFRDEVSNVRCECVRVVSKVARSDEELFKWCVGILSQLSVDTDENVRKTVEAVMEEFDKLNY